MHATFCVKVVVMCLHSFRAGSVGHVVSNLSQCTDSPGLEWSKFCARFEVLLRGVGSSKFVSWCKQFGVGVVQDAHKV